MREHLDETVNFYGKDGKEFTQLKSDNKEAKTSEHKEAKTSKHKENKHTEIAEQKFHGSLLGYLRAFLKDNQSPPDVKQKERRRG